MTDPLTVVFQRRATREIEEIDAWWRLNRPSAADLFLTELERMLSAIAMMPRLGTPAQSQRVKGVHRILLRRTRYHVFYRTRGDTLEVLAVWHAERGAGPGL
jgi:plasmid stabilization system protein ParE